MVNDVVTESSIVVSLAPKITLEKMAAHWRKPKRNQKYFEHQIAGCRQKNKPKLLKSLIPKLRSSP